MSCIVGNNKVNAIDYNKDELRKWSKKGILKCPICEEKLIYKSGMIKNPHFAHKNNSDCSYTYYENETKEHHIGKILLYKWLKKNNEIMNLELESWISETRQRPDLKFEHKDKIYVIEFQCTPITLEEYYERSKKYHSIDIQDIWIFGMDRYSRIIKEDKYYTYTENATESNFKDIIKIDYMNKKLYRLCRTELDKFTLKKIIGFNELLEISKLNSYFAFMKIEHHLYFKEKIEKDKLDRVHGDAIKQNERLNKIKEAINDTDKIKSTNINIINNLQLHIAITILRPYEVKDFKFTIMKTEDVLPYICNAPYGELKHDSIFIIENDSIDMLRENIRQIGLEYDIVFVTLQNYYWRSTAKYYSKGKRNASIYL